jgi:hypothetical protein
MERRSGSRPRHRDTRYKVWGIGEDRIGHNNVGGRGKVATVPRWETKGRRRISGGRNEVKELCGTMHE